MQNYGRFSKYYYNFFFGFALFFVAVELSNIAIAMGMDINVGSIICFMTGVLMLFMGNMMPKIKQNFFFGIKTPWALNDEENWFKTHRLGGKMFAIAGVVIMAAAFVPGESKVWVLLAMILVMVFIPMIYSYLLFRDKQRES
jgi:uncharacterized membrane protein